jgi:hypothetical protein
MHMLIDQKMKGFEAEKGSYITRILYYIYLRLGARKVMAFCIRYFHMDGTAAAVCIYVFMTYWAMLPVCRTG